MNREKQIEDMARKICPCIYNHNDCESCDLYEHESCLPFNIARELADNNYRKASEVALETVDDFQRRIRNIFIGMCDDNDYHKLNLLQIDCAIEAFYDTFIDELKKKYTEDGK